MNSLEVKNVSKSFANFQLHDISFNLPKGYIMGLVGANGSGKSTTIKLIMNMLDKEDGQILVMGKDNVLEEVSVKHQIGVIYDKMYFVDIWAVETVPSVLKSFFPDWNNDEFFRLVKRFKLPLKSKIKELSKGMQMKLMLSCILCRDTKLLILDEPTSSFDPAMRDEFCEILQEYISDGEKSVLFSTQIISDLENISDYITFLDKGTVIYTGTKDGVIGQFKTVKGETSELTDILKKQIIGIRKTSMGFEGLIKIEDADNFKQFTLESPSLNDIIIFISKGGN